MEVYVPAEDSFLFERFLKHEVLPSLSADASFLDMGTGSGILARTACEFLDPKNVLAVDCNSLAVEQLESAPFKVIHSNLFENVSESFDVVVCNAPYLPRDVREPVSSQLATTGGKRGDEFSVQFLEQVKLHLNTGGKVFLLVSSLTPMDRLQAYNPKVVATKKVAYEELRVLEFAFK